MGEAEAEVARLEKENDIEKELARLEKENDVEKELARLEKENENVKVSVTKLGTDTGSRPIEVKLVTSTMPEGLSIGEEGDPQNDQQVMKTLTVRGRRRTATSSSG